MAIIGIKEKAVTGDSNGRHASVILLGGQKFGGFMRTRQDLAALDRDRNDLLSFSQIPILDREGSTMVV